MCLSFQTSARAKPFIWKWFLFAWNLTYTCRWNTVSNDREDSIVLTQSQKAGRKCWAIHENMSFCSEQWRRQVKILTTRFCLRLSLFPQVDPFEIIFNYRRNTYCHRQRSFQGNKDVDLAVVSAVCIICRVCVETAEDRLIRQTSKSTSFSKYWKWTHFKTSRLWQHGCN